MYIFLHIICCHDGIRYKEKVEEENLNSRMVAEAERKRSLYWNFKACIHYFLSIFNFSPNDSPLKPIKMFFISLKKLFSFSRHSNFCNFFPSFPHFPDSKGQMEVK